MKAQLPQTASPSHPHFFWNLPITSFAGMFAQLFVQPVVMVKVRIQLRSQSRGSLSPISVIKEIYNNEGGFRGFYKGLDAGLFRQFVFSPVRMGAFYLLSDFLKKRKPKNQTKLLTREKIFCAGLTGAIGAFFCTPFDVAMVRMQSDVTLPTQLRRHYTGVFNALSRIPREDGVKGLFRGVIPNMARCSELNMVMMVTFQEAKERIVPYLGNNKKTVLLSSILSGIITAILSLPFDNMKTKLQKMKELPDGSLPYKGLTDCFLKTIRREGVLGLWSGLRVYFFSVTPHAFIALVTTQFLRRHLGYHKHE